MSRIRVDRLTNKSGTGAPLFTDGVNVVGLTNGANVVAGIATATTFSGSLSGNATSATNASRINWYSKHYCWFCSRNHWYF